MLHVDVLTAFFNTGAAALVAAAIIGLTRTDQARLRAALRTCAWGMVMLGVGLVPAGMGAEVAALPAAQFSITFFSLAGIVLIGQGLGRTQGRRTPATLPGVFLVVAAAVLLVALNSGPLAFAHSYTRDMLAASLLATWAMCGFIVRPRNAVELGLGLMALTLTLSAVARIGFALAYSGPPRVDIMLAPDTPAALFASLYAVMPITVATLLLSLVNTRLQHRLHARASTDELTSLLTRRALRELAATMLEQEHKRRSEVAVVLIDLDHFKSVNDQHGHAVGDEVLRFVAATLKAQLRSDALLARYGGEEFVAMLPAIDLPGARRAAERLRAAVQDEAWAQVAAFDRGLTVSIGVALAGPGDDLDRTLQRADEALYRAKRDGRNQVQVSLRVA